MDGPTNDGDDSATPKQDDLESSPDIANEQGSVPPALESTSNIARGGSGDWPPLPGLTAPGGASPLGSSSMSDSPSFGPEIAESYRGPSQPEDASRPSPKVPPYRSRRVLAVAVVAVVLASVGLGVVVGHAVWTPTSSTPALSPTTSLPTTTLPGTTLPSSTLPRPARGSSAPGAPSNEAAIAKNTDPGLVDINITDAYEALQGAGTGMVLSSSGEILTNNHVIEGATTISVTDIGNGKTYHAMVVGYDRSHDIAVLQLTDASRLSTVKLGDSSKVRKGQGGG